MRPSALILIAVMAAAPALAETGPANPPKQQPAPAQLHKPKPKTTGAQMPAPSPSPNAGTTTPGTPTGAASNGGEQGY
jgi:hypothetical protein